MIERRTTRWRGVLPTHCDICHTSLLGQSFVDGETRLGTWAIMCVRCHAIVGKGFGRKIGCEYQADGRKA